MGSWKTVVCMLVMVFVAGTPALASPSGGQVGLTLLAGTFSPTSSDLKNNISGIGSFGGEVHVRTEDNGPYSLHLALGFERIDEDLAASLPTPRDVHRDLIKWRSSVYLEQDQFLSTNLPCRIAEHEISEEVPSHTALREKS